MMPFLRPLVANHATLGHFRHQHRQGFNLFRADVLGDDFLFDKRGINIKRSVSFADITNPNKATCSIG